MRVKNLNNYYFYLQRDKTKWPSVEAATERRVTTVSNYNIGSYRSCDLTTIFYGIYNNSWY